MKTNSEPISESQVQKKTRTRPGPIRLRDVAELAHVSPATASRIMNGDGSVSEELRDRVLVAVAELGYRPNRIAQNLRRQRIDAIAVVISDIENPHFTEMVRAVEDEAYRLGHRVLVANTDARPDKQATYLRMLADERVSGVILNPSNPTGPEIGALLDVGIPVVAFDQAVADLRADAVLADNVGGVRAATRLLITLGHRDIAYVGGRPNVQTSEERLEGYLAAIEEAGLAPRTTAGDFRTAGGHRAVAELLASEHPPTGLVVANNLMTVGALQACRSAGVKIPDRLALVAVDDPLWAELTDPPLTTAAQPVRAMAESAMEMLVERIYSGRTEPRRVVHPFELRRRGSSGPVINS